MKISELVRKNILSLKPYASARDEFSGEADIFLDANENSLAGKYKRYPDPLQRDLKKSVASFIGVKPEQLFLGNGSDEAIDLLYRVFCEPGQDSVLLFPPTYGMYAVSAEINNVRIINQPLTENFQLPAINSKAKLAFLCSPNNPTGNDLSRDGMIKFIREFPGIVAVDEAYIHFSDQPSLVSEIEKYPNLVVLQTFSKAIGMAGIRLGIAIANEELINFFNKVKPPYNVSALTQEAGLTALQDMGWFRNTVKDIKESRELLVKQLGSCPVVEQIYPSSANFHLVKVKGAKKVYKKLIEEGIVVRDRSGVLLCDECLRITVGTPKENQLLVNIMAQI